MVSCMLYMLVYLLTRNPQAQMSALGIPQIAIVHGISVAGQWRQVAKYHRID